MNRARLVPLAVLALIAGETFPMLRPASAAPAAPVEAKAPEAKAGPYRVVIDRLSESDTLTLNYRVEANRRESGVVQSQRTVQLQLAVFAAESAPESGLASFEIKSVTVGSGSRLVEAPYYGGVLEVPGNGALLRAYLSIPRVPPRARELRALEGEIVSYEKAATVELEVPVETGGLPRTVEKDGLKATLREFTVSGGVIRLALALEGAEESVIIDTSTDGARGVTVQDTDNRAATAAGGTVTQLRPNQAEYRLTFQGSQAAVSRVRVRVLHRSGPRRVFPFRIKRVPLGGGPKQPDGKHQ
ncbi:MAG TPA: hypothetical protein VK689_05335 [Armatimonadota bacterium]|nr:hypothetical protein [Armatimonadota bacterium]